MTKPARYTFSGDQALQILTEFDALLASRGLAIHGPFGQLSAEEREALFDEFLARYRVPEFSGADMGRVK